MPKLSKQKLEDILRKNIPLSAPIFKLQNYGGRLSGSIVSETFEGKRDNERQKMIWDALDRSLGPTAVTSVGMILAYTPYEWGANASIASGGAAKSA